MKSLNFLFVFVFAFLLSTPVFSQFFDEQQTSSAKFSRSGDKGYVGEEGTEIVVTRLSAPPPEYPRRAVRLGYCSIRV